VVTESRRPSPDEEAAAAELMARIEGAAVRRLGDVASVVGGVEPPEHDDFHWDDSATWSPPLVSEYSKVNLPAEEVEELFGQPDEQMGTVEDWGWHGLVRHERRPGGYILVEDDQGFREVREFVDTEGLETQWQRLNETYERWVEERDSYEAATQEPVPGHSGLAPRVYISSLADYNAGRLFGMWADATLDADTLGAAVRFMLRQSREDVAEEIAIHDTDDFGGYEVGEYEPLATVSKIAQGIAEYGPAYAAWASVIGTDERQLDLFNDCYRGTYDSFKDYIDELVDELEYERVLEQLPEDIRCYVIFDTEQMARDWEADYHVVEAPGGGVFVFDTRM
jgi:antirestriction protein